MTMKEALGAVIHDLRVRRNKTQTALARELGVTRQCLRFWELGTTSPGIEALPRVAAALGATTPKLVLAVCRRAGVQ